MLAVMVEWVMVKPRGWGVRTRGTANWREAYYAKRPRSSGELIDFKRKVWYWLSGLEKTFKEAILHGDNDTTLRAAHALNQVGTLYSRLLLGQDTEERLRRLEEAKAAPSQESQTFDMWMKSDGTRN